MLIMFLNLRKYNNNILINQYLESAILIRFS